MWSDNLLMCQCLCVFRPHRETFVWSLMFVFGWANLEYFIEQRGVSINKSIYKFNTSEEKDNLSQSLLGLIFNIQLPSCVCLFVTPMECSTPSFPVSHHLPEFAQVHVHLTGDPSNHLICRCLLVPSIYPIIRSFPKSWIFHISWAKYWRFSFSIVLPMSIQDWFPLGWSGWLSLQSKGCSRVFSNTAVQKHQFFSTLLCLWSSSHIHTWLQERPKPWLYRPLSAKWYLCFLYNV